MLGRTFFPLSCWFILSSPIVGAADPNTVTKAIDNHLAKKWREENVARDTSVSDLEFLRRISLDLIGRPASVDEIHAYLKEVPAERRRKCVDRLLDSPAYAAHWSERWTTWTLDNPNVAPEQRQGLRGWFEKRLIENGSYRSMVSRLLTASGTPKDDPAVHYWTANRGEAVAADLQRQQGQYDMLSLTENALRIFLGRDAGCARCHDHPFEVETRQRDYWTQPSFFRQVRWKEESENRGRQSTYRIDEDAAMNRDRILKFTTRIGKTMGVEMAFLDGAPIARDDPRSRRVLFADWVIRQPGFSKVYLARIWTELFGGSPISDRQLSWFTENNPSMLPEMFEELAKIFQESNYDMKAALRGFCQSEPYQRSVSQKRVDGSVEHFFETMLRKPLSVAVCGDSIAAVLHFSETLDEKQRASWHRNWELLHALPLQPSDETQAMPPGEGHWRRAEKVFFQTNAEIGSAIRHPKGIVARAMEKKTDSETLGELFLMVLNRHASENESNGLSKQLRSFRLDQPTKPTNEFWEDLTYVLLMSTEFQENR